MYGRIGLYRQTIIIITGLVILPSYLSHSQQRDLVHWSLSEHSKWPNETNLDTHYDIPQDGIWTMHTQSTGSVRDRDLAPRILPKVLSNSPPPTSVVSEPVGPRQLIQNIPASPENYDQLLNEPKPSAAPSTTVSPASATELLPKLRWANIGWFYHWGTKQYDFSRGKVAVGEIVRRVCRGVVEAVVWEDVFRGGLWGEGEEEWRTWSTTYGMFYLTVMSSAHNINYSDRHTIRARCGDCQLLPTQGMYEKLNQNIFVYSDITLGYTHGTCRSVGSMCNLASRIDFVRSQSSTMTPNPTS